MYRDFQGHFLGRIQASSQLKNLLKFSKFVKKFPIFFTKIQIQTGKVEFGKPSLTQISRVDNDQNKAIYFISNFKFI